MLLALVGSSGVKGVAGADGQVERGAEYGAGDIDGNGGSYPQRVGPECVGGGASLAPGTRGIWPVLNLHAWGGYAAVLRRQGCQVILRVELQGAFVLLTCQELLHIRVAVRVYGNVDRLGVTTAVYRGVPGAFQSAQINEGDYIDRQRAFHGSVMAVGTAPALDIPFLTCPIEVMSIALIVHGVYCAPEVEDG